MTNLMSSSRSTIITPRTLETVNALADARVAEDDLFAELGDLVGRISRDADEAGRYRSDGQIETEGFAEGSLELGRRIFSRLEREFFGLICGDRSEDSEDREQMRDAFGLGSDAVTGAIVALLTSGFGVAPAIATVVAALLIRRVFRPGYEETCRYWGESHDGSVETGT